MFEKQSWKNQVYITILIIQIYVILVQRIIAYVFIRTFADTFINLLCTDSEEPFVWKFTDVWITFIIVQVPSLKPILLWNYNLKNKLHVYLFQAGFKKLVLYLSQNANK